MLINYFGSSYAYCDNNPVNCVDPTGMIGINVLSATGWFAYGATPSILGGGGWDLLPESPMEPEPIYFVWAFDAWGNLIYIEAYGFLGPYLLDEFVFSTGLGVTSTSSYSIATPAYMWLSSIISFESSLSHSEQTYIMRVLYTTIQFGGTVKAITGTDEKRRTFSLQNFSSFSGEKLTIGRGNLDIIGRDVVGYYFENTQTILFDVNRILSPELIIHEFLHIAGYGSDILGRWFTEEPFGLTWCEVVSNPLWRRALWRMPFWWPFLTQ